MNQANEEERLRHWAEEPGGTRNGRNVNNHSCCARNGDLIEAAEDSATEDTFTSVWPELFKLMTLLRGQSDTSAEETESGNLHIKEWSTEVEMVRISFPCGPGISYKLASLNWTR